MGVPLVKPDRSSFRLLAEAVQLEQSPRDAETTGLGSAERLCLVGMEQQGRAAAPSPTQGTGLASGEKSYPCLGFTRRASSCYKTN